MKNDKNIFDPAMILDNLMNDKEIVIEILEGFLIDIPKQINNLQNYLDNRDVEGVERQAHTIKGASANVGAAALQTFVYEMEKTGKAGEFESVQKEMPQLSKEFNTLKDLIEATIATWKN